MGYNLNIFASPVDQNLICNICAGVMNQAVVTSCGHSFCHACLSTWLAKPDVESCPVCRAYTSRYELIPNICMRSMIGSLSVWCDHKEHGCNMVVKLEGLKKHHDVCDYRQVECVACQQKLRHCDLAVHCTNCKAISQEVKKSSKMENLLSIDLLTRKIVVLELELKQTKKALERSKLNVTQLEIDLTELQTQANTLSTSLPDFDPDYSYGYSPSSISQLSCLIAKYLLAKPAGVDRNRIFMAIKRSFTYYHNYAGYAEDVHMLLATAYASNWFPEHHRWTLERWLEQLAHERFPRQLSNLENITS